MGEGAGELKGVFCEHPEGLTCLEGLLNSLLRGELSNFKPESACGAAHDTKPVEAIPIRA